MNGKAYSLNDSWEFTTAKVGVYNHFIIPNRSEHNRKQNSSAWTDKREKGSKIYELQFCVCQEHIKYNIGHKSWPARMLRGDIKMVLMLETKVILQTWLN